jgi:hypothetical protein
MTVSGITILTVPTENNEFIRYLFVIYYVLVVHFQIDCLYVYLNSNMQVEINVDIN